MVSNYLPQLLAEHERLAELDEVERKSLETELTPARQEAKQREESLTQSQQQRRQEHDQSYEDLPDHIVSYAQQQSFKQVTHIPWHRDVFRTLQRRLDTLDVYVHPNGYYFCKHSFSWWHGVSFRFESYLFGESKPPYDRIAESIVLTEDIGNFSYGFRSGQEVPKGVIACFPIGLLGALLGRLTGGVLLGLIGGGAGMISGLAGPEIYRQEKKKAAKKQLNPLGSNRAEIIAQELIKFCPPKEKQNSHK